MDNLQNIIHVFFKIRYCRSPYRNELAHNFYMQIKFYKEYYCKFIKILLSLIIAAYLKAKCRLNAAL